MPNVTRVDAALEAGVVEVVVAGRMHGWSGANIEVLRRQKVAVCRLRPMKAMYVPIPVRFRERHA